MTSDLRHDPALPRAKQLKGPYRERYVGGVLVRVYRDHVRVVRRTPSELNVETIAMFSRPADALAYARELRRAD